MVATAEKTRLKVRAHRARLRKKGMRLVQFWIPDVRTKAFRKAAHLQSLAVAQSAHERDDQAFVDSISTWPNGE